MSGPNPPTESHALEQTVPAGDGLRRPEPSAEPLARGMAVGRYTVLDRIAHDDRICSHRGGSDLHG